ncbi:uncharacterized protein LOC135832390 [Planococcus citri]|uniref:uncharacterized protein LOC135832390 n=1 Tax=Planococcus citri TaxID=170843 RepID=UPI0031FA1915
MSGLCSLRTNSCCCCISLRTGTITIVILNLIGTVAVIFNHQKFSKYGTSFLVGQIIFLIIELAALYGVFNRKPDFLIPHLAVTALFLLGFLLVIIASIIFLPFAYNALKDMTYETPDGKMEHLSKTMMDAFYFFYILIVVFAIVYEAIRFHFFKVVLGHYRELKTILLSINPPPIGFAV